MCVGLCIFVSEEHFWSKFLNYSSSLHLDSHCSMISGHINWPFFLKKLNGTMRSRSSYNAFLLLMSIQCVRQTRTGLKQPPWNINSADIVSPGPKLDFWNLFISGCTAKEYFSRERKGIMIWTYTVELECSFLVFFVWLVVFGFFISLGFFVLFYFFFFFSNTRLFGV